MTRAVAQTPNDLVLSSTTESQEAIEHAVSENWKESFVPAAEKEAAEKAAKEAAEKVLADAKLAAERKDAEAIDSEKDSQKDGEESDQELLTAEEKELLDRKAKGDKSVGKLPWSTRVNKLTARLASEREARERLEARLAALERGDKSTDRGGDSTPALADLPGKPKRVDYTDEETYVSALIKYERANEDYKEQVIEEREHAGRVFREHGARISEARERYEDWDELANSDAAQKTILAPALDFAIREMSNSADVIYHLIKNPKIYEAMSKLSISQQVIEAGRISDRLLAQGGGNGNGSSGKPRKTRQAPPEPITPSGRRSTTQPTKLEDIAAKQGVDGTEEYIRARRAMRAGRAN